MSGKLLVVVAALLWSTGGLFAKAPLFHDWPAESRGALLACWRTLFAGLVLLPFVRKPRWNPRYVPMVFLFTGMNATYMTALILTTAGNAIWLQCMSPLYVLVIGVVWLKEKTVPSDYLMFAFGFLGVGLILFCEMRAATAIPGVLFGVASGLFYAGVVLMFRVLRGEDPALLVAISHLATGLLMLPYVVWLGVYPSPLQFLVLAAYGVVQMGVPYLLFAKALQTLPGHEASLIGLVEPCVVPLWVYLVWDEQADWWTLAGGGLILCGLIWRYGFASRKPIVPTPAEEPIPVPAVAE